MKYIKLTIQANGVVLVSLLLTLNLFPTVFQCFYCGFWACVCLLCVNVFLFQSFLDLMVSSFHEVEYFQEVECTVYELTALIINELHTFFISNTFFQPQCCLTFSLLRCCLIHISIIMLRNFLYLGY